MHDNYIIFKPVNTAECFFFYKSRTKITLEINDDEYHSFIQSFIFLPFLNPRKENIYFTLFTK